MCGFAAMVNIRPRAVDRTAVRRMTDVLQHRGPDERAWYFDDAVGLGLVCLAPPGPTPAGRHPILSDDASTAVVLDGEIYNRVELRHQLEQSGHTFRYGSDGEVLLHAHRQWGTRCLDRLNGVWAFLLYDRHGGRILGARDRFGVKPLYRFRRGDATFFASEIKAIRASGHCPGATNWRLAAQLLRGRSLDHLDCFTESFHAGIEPIPAGVAFEMDLTGRCHEWRYWEFPVGACEPVRDPAGELRELFRDTVRLRTRGDVATAVSLSGGLDSTSIISTVARLRGTEPGISSEIHAFSYAEPRFDEARYIQATIAQTGAQLHPVEVDPLRLWESLGRVLWFHDEPVHSMNVLVAFDICRMARAAGLPVLLSGSGADEVLGGYKTFFRKYWNTLLLSGRVHRAWAEIGAFCELHGRERSVEAGRAAEHLIKQWLARSDALRGWRHGRHVRRVPRDTWLDADLAHAEQAPELERDDILLEDAMRTAVTAAPLPLYLRIEDRNAAAHAVHVRLPFLDHRLAELASRLSADWKLRGPWNKFVLREAMRGTIPEVVRTRVDKMGFPDAARDWFRGALYEPMQDLLASDAVRMRGIYDVAAIRRDLERHRAGDVDVATRLFNVAQLEAWFSLGRSYCCPDVTVAPDAPSIVGSSMSPSSVFPASHQPLVAS